MAWLEKTKGLSQNKCPTVQADQVSAPGTVETAQSFNHNPLRNHVRRAVSTLSGHLRSDCLVNQSAAFHDR